MSRITLHIASLVLASGLAASAHAQDAAPAIALNVDNGSVLVSTGGEFAQATSGQAIAPGHRVLVPEGGSASLKYGNGCAKSLATAGVYTVTADCDLASTSRSVSTGTVLGIVGGVAVIAAVAGGGGSDDDNNNKPPISR
ncbi:hypothetical protein [Luteimonas sp. MC1572]|uniref:hypothetical protein n=1 Tax=Luteimonas sp. MC1572 TaxID=2799325 RepID=UPI0018F0DF97|nr:hypothetical protein [Luteimonas sp. MC1572]MBJ6982994.1 hypothetical protein [Luteimonas sp. MC1572]QQO04209.1 hypothetical protein JGR64_05540 [Luteimonas sp. MC1572]